MTREDEVKAEVRGSVRAPTVIAVGQLGVGLVVLAVGIGYDWWEREPGLVTLAGLTLLAGPGFLVAYLRARAIQAGKIVHIPARLKEHDDAG